MDVPSTSNEGPDSFGTATYALSRHRKNKIMIWQSRKLEGRVYEFTLASRLRRAGVFSWRCLHCALLRDSLKKTGGDYQTKKIPLVLVDNDVIKEDPDRPLNAAHFCQGRDLVEAAVLRSKLLFYDVHSQSSPLGEEVVEEYAEEAAKSAPFDLTVTQKRKVEKYIHENMTAKRMKKTIQRRKRLAAESPPPPPTPMHDHRLIVAKWRKPVKYESFKYADGDAPADQLAAANDLSPLKDYVKTERNLERHRFMKRTVQQLPYPAVVVERIQERVPAPIRESLKEAKTEKEGQSDCDSEQYIDVEGDDDVVPPKQPQKPVLPSPSTNSRMELHHDIMIAREVVVRTTPSTSRKAN